MSGGRKRQKDAEHCNIGKLRRRIAEGNANQSGQDTDLTGQHPTAPPAQNLCQLRQGRPVDDGRPDEFEREQNPDPAKVSDRCAFHFLLPEPRRQRAENQEIGKPRREAQEQHRNDAGMPVDLERIEPGL